MREVGRIRFLPTHLYFCRWLVMKVLPKCTKTTPLDLSEVIIHQTSAWMEVELTVCAIISCDYLWVLPTLDLLPICQLLPSFRLIHFYFITFQGEVFDHSLDIEKRK